MGSWIRPTSRLVGLSLPLALGGSIAACTALLGDFTVASGASGDDGSFPDGASAEGGPQDDASHADDAAEDAGAEAATQAPDAPSCAANEKTCNGGCVNTGLPGSGCASASSCEACAIPGAVATCDSKGECAIGKCATGFADCNQDASDGCEVDTASDPKNCGQCKLACSAAGGSPNCSGGECTSIACAAPSADCDHDASDGCETNTHTSAANCGSCGNACGTGNGTSSCGDAGCAFACNAPYAHCPTSKDPDGCDVNTSNDSANCGACGKACLSTQSCAGSACACDPTKCTSGCCSGATCVPPSPSTCGGKGGSASCVDCMAVVANASAIACSSNNECTYGACNSGYADADGDATNGCEAVSSPATVGAGSLALWFSADTGWTVDSAGMVLWSDQSPGGHSALAGGSVAPTKVAGALNGHAILSFNGAKFLELASAPTFGASGLTWFLVYEPANTMGNYEPLLSFNTNGNAGSSTTPTLDPNRLALTHNAADNYLAYSDCANGNCPGGGANVWTAAWHVLSLRHQSGAVGAATAVDLHDNGTDYGASYFNGATTGVTLPATTARNPSFIGHDTANRYFNGNMAEIIVFTSSLSAADEAAVEAYLRHKYAI